MVDRPNHTQLCAFVVDSRCRRASRNIGKWPDPEADDDFAAAAAAVATAAAAALPLTIVLPPATTVGRSILLFSNVIILCLEAYTKHDTTNMNMAKQNVVSSTYMPISNVVDDAECCSGCNGNKPCLW